MATYDLKPFRKMIRDGIFLGAFGLFCGAIVVLFFVYEQAFDFNGIFCVVLLSITFLLLTVVSFWVIKDAYKDLKHQEYLTFQALVLEKDTGIQGRASWYYHLKLELLDNGEQALLLGKFLQKETLNNETLSAKERLIYTANTTKEDYSIFDVNDTIRITLSRYSRHIMELKKV